MNDEMENVVVFGIYLFGTVAVLIGMFMWQGGWAALTAVGLLAALLAISQSTVMATSAGARSIVKAIVRAGSLERTNIPASGVRPALTPSTPETGRTSLRSS
jgi:hypothetical protein